uniref:Uncharacterized protein n=1 Tax=Anguilla anguilla TaxID=7936 RepID=A0A0E9SSB5_ANGAN
MAVDFLQVRKVMIIFFFIINFTLSPARQAKPLLYSYNLKHENRFE